ncbi:hypothetical protein LptCag_0013 [Leptospirillum ferriphilum]|uniref:Uncharacterized protein n=1 Tax=Leptospirillum ferriphilum TaxID=178606 RepID=A0A094YHB5_9BACT|nr:hypothetical protein LptCag_0013 [Leptospirillum ferriphilum]
MGYREPEKKEKTEEGNTRERTTKALKESTLAERYRPGKRKKQFLFPANLHAIRLCSNFVRSDRVVL